MIDKFAMVMPMVGPGKGYKDMLVGDYIEPRQTPPPGATKTGDTAMF
jgi:hypothetical protein